MKVPTKCYIYTRVSTEMQVEGYSLEAQKETMKQYAALHEYVIVGEYSDEGVSGKNIKNRPEFQRMMRDIQEGIDGVSFVIVFKLSRFGRNSADVLNSLQLIREPHAGWSLKVVTDPKKHLGFGLYYASEPVMKSDEAAVKQLVGKKIDAIYMTHLDCDHISGLHDFSGIPIFASADEIEEANRNKIRYGKLIRDIKVNTMCFDNDGNAPFGKSKDLFGDGSVIAYLTPTHSKGSVVYKICDENAFALIVGDNGYKKDSWEKGILPGPLYNPENMKRCLSWIKNKSQDNKCVGVYCAHEPYIP